MNSLCLQLWVVLYSWNSRSWCSLPTPTDAKLVLSYLPCQIHLLTLSFNIFVCFVVFFSFFHLLLFFCHIYLLTLSGYQICNFMYAKTFYALFCRKNNFCNFCWQKWFTHFVRKLFARSNLPSEKSGYMIMIIIQSCKNVQTVRSSRCYFFWPVLIFGKSTQKTANFWEKHAKNC